MSHSRFSPIAALLLAISAEGAVAHLPSSVFGRISDAESLVRMDGRIRAAFDFLRRKDLAQLPDGRYEIDGSNVYATVSSPRLMPFAEARVEAHRRYVDIHVPMAGRETFGVHELTTAELSLPFDCDSDCIMLDAKLRPVTVGEGEFALFYPPAGGHAPGCTLEEKSPDGFRKIVVKVKVGEK